jgi:hypothetical protein
MSYRNLHWIVLIGIFLSTASYAQDDQVITNVGIGVSNSYGTRMVSLGIQEDLWGTLKQRGMGGFWIDDSGNGRNSSAFISGQLGFEVNSNGTVVSIFTGPALISIPDSYLGGPFQFMSDVHWGVQDMDLNYIGVYYRHISSAGLETPNVGRDIVGLEIRF